MPIFKKREDRGLFSKKAQKKSAKLSKIDAKIEKIKANPKLRTDTRVQMIGDQLYNKYYPTERGDTFWTRFRRWLANL